MTFICFTTGLFSNACCMCVRLKAENKNTSLEKNAIEKHVFKPLSSYKLVEYFCSVLLHCLLPAIVQFTFDNKLPFC